MRGPRVMRPACGIVCGRVGTHRAYSAGDPTPLPSGFVIVARRLRHRIIAAAACGISVIGLGGCQTAADFYCGLQIPQQNCETQVVVPANQAVPTTVTVQDPTEVKYYPSDEPLRLGIEHFGRGNYGMAERYFRDAVEKAPRDVTAWVGLAASYDRLRRFDLADQAYAQAIRLRGPTVQILNNQGYSYMLRGDLASARQKFLHAYKLNPTNPTI